MGLSSFLLSSESWVLSGWREERNEANETPDHDSWVESCSRYSLLCSHDPVEETKSLKSGRLVLSLLEAQAETLHYGDLPCLGRRNVSLCFMRTTHCHFPSDHAPSDNRRQAKLRFNIQPPLICESAETAIGDGCYLVFDQIAESKSSHAFYGSEVNTLRFKSNNNVVRGVSPRAKTIVYDNRHYWRSCLSVACSDTSKYQTKNLQKAFRIPMKLIAWLQFSNLLYIHIVPLPFQPYSQRNSCAKRSMAIWSTWETRNELELLTRFLNRNYPGGDGLLERRMKRFLI